jgi:hypothetical protein
MALIYSLKWLQQLIDLRSKNGSRKTNRQTSEYIPQLVSICLCVFLPIY